MSMSEFKPRLGAKYWAFPLLSAASVWGKVAFWYFWTQIRKTQISTLDASVSLPPLLAPYAYTMMLVGFTFLRNIPQIFIEHLLYIWHLSRSWKYSSEQKSLSFHGVMRYTNKNKNKGLGPFPKNYSQVHCQRSHKPNS